MFQLQEKAQAKCRKIFFRDLFIFMSELDLTKYPHRRFNPLLREWVLVSPHRNERPWQGQVESSPAAAIVKYDPACYMCPGNKRSTGAANPDYKNVFVFDNDFPALLPNSPDATSNVKNLLVAQVETGICRVLCFSPRHDLTLSQMNVSEIRLVVDEWVAQFQELGGREEIRHVQIFENRGAIMGASNPHPHCQIWQLQLFRISWPRNRNRSVFTKKRMDHACSATTLRSNVSKKNASSLRTNTSSRWFPSGRSGRSRRWCFRSGIFPGCLR